MQGLTVISSATVAAISQRAISTVVLGLLAVVLVILGLERRPGQSLSRRQTG